jgi:hypothetical protein
VNTFLILLIASYALYDSLSLQELPGQRGLYAVIFGVLAVILVSLVGFGRLRIGKSYRWLLLGWLILGVFYMVLALNQPIHYPAYMLGDFASILFPFMILLCGFCSPGLFTDESSLKLMAVILGIAALIATAFRMESGRYQSPNSLLMTLIWIWFYRSRAKATRLLLAACLAILLVLAILSGERTSVVTWVVVGTVMFYMNGVTVKRIASLAIALTLLGGGLALTAGSTGIWEHARKSSRIDARVEGETGTETDRSLHNR